MIQYIAILLGIGILGMIYYRRSYILTNGNSPFEFTKKRQRSLFHFPAFWHDDHDFEITVDEMIPAPETIDLRNQAKADLLRKKGDSAFERSSDVMGDEKKVELRNAEKLYIQALSLDPSNRECYCKLGLIYVENSQFGKAEMMFRKLVVTGFVDGMYLSNLGHALHQQKKFPEAKSFYQKALETDPLQPENVFRLAQVFYELREFEQAVEHFQKAAGMDPQNLGYLLTLAHLYDELGMKDEVKKLLSEILILFPANNEARTMLTTLL